MVRKQLFNEISEQYDATGREPEAELIIAYTSPTI
jgi:hypothetical protein